MKTMTILFSTILLVLMGCSKEEENNNNADTLVSGKWYYETTDGVEGDACKKQTSIEFTDAGAYLVDAHAIVSGSCTQNMLTGSYVVDGNAITVTLMGVDAPSTYTIADGILTVTGVNPATGVTQSSTYDKTSG